MIDKINHNRDRLQEYRKTVRVYGIRRQKFIEFDFTVEFEELTIELVMPYDAFKEFCETNHVVAIECAADVKDAFHQIAGENLPVLQQNTNKSDQEASSEKLNDQGNIIQLGDFK